MSERRRSRVIWLSVAVGFAVTLAVAVSQSDWLRQALGLSVSEAYGGKLTAAAEEFNARLPMMVSADTRLDSTAAVGEEFHYNYTLVSQVRADLDPEQLASALRPTLARSVCSNAEMRVFMSPGVDLVYNYAAKDGTHVVSIRIERGACTS